MKLSSVLSTSSKLLTQIFRRFGVFVSDAPLGEGCYRVAGGASIRDWNDFFEAEVVPNAFETVGGYVTALLGRLPRDGDEVTLGAGLGCKVTEVRGRRVLSVELYLEGSQGGNS